MTSGIMPTVGVPAGDSRIVGGVSTAPTVTPEDGCPVQYYKTGCNPPNDRQQWNWLIANIIAAQNDCGLNYDCASTDQLRELICCLARKCAMLCRSTVTPAPAVWPPVDYSGPFVVDDTAVPPVLYFWDCNSLVYVSTATSTDFCAAIPVDTYIDTEPVYQLQCINGVMRRVEVTSSGSCYCLYADESWHHIPQNPNPLPWQLIAPPAYALPSRIASIVTTGQFTAEVTFAAPFAHTGYYADVDDTAFGTGTVSNKTVNGFTATFGGPLVNNVNTYRVFLKQFQ